MGVVVCCNGYKVVRSAEGISLGMISENIPRFFRVKTFSSHLDALKEIRYLV